jgi:protein-disulfide isomerase
LAGIGFTVALLIADISFDGAELDDAKIGILAASVIASALAVVVFQVIRRLPADVGADGLAEPIVDLVDDVDPERDHIRGPIEAPLTLVEYGDFECPYCGQAEPVLRELARDFGSDLRFVFRHLPLVDVHEHAQLAAEAAEAAGAQGRFWELHDRLMAHQDTLDLDALRAHATELGLDVARFVEEIESRRYSLEVERDVERADLGGVTGTPTFFINGRRHHGAFDLASLTAALRRELAASGR